MRQRNINTTDMGTDHQGIDVTHPEPRIFYGTITNFPHPNTHTVFPLPEHHENALPYMGPQFISRDFQAPRNHEHIPFSTIQVVGYPCIDNVRPSYKRKTGPGPSSSSSSNVQSIESANNQVNETLENESPEITRNRFGFIGAISVPPHNYIHQPFQLPGNPWLGMQFINHEAMTWNNQAPPLPYNGNGVMAIRRTYHPMLRNVTNIHPPLPPPIREIRNRNIPQNPFEARPRYLAPVPPTGFRLYRPHIREDTGHRNLAHLRVLPEDGVAMLEVVGYHGVVDAVDRHRDMRLDIDHMSYEELLALGERIGSVESGVSEETIITHLKTRSFISLIKSPHQEESPSSDQDLDFCVICQNEYKNEDTIGSVDCGHEYHTDCIKKWLLMKNACPICKSTALKTEN